MTGNQGPYEVYQELTKVGFVIFLEEVKEVSVEKGILLKVLGNTTLYTFDMKNVAFSKGYRLVISKSLSNEVKLWHRRVGSLDIDVQTEEAAELMVVSSTSPTEATRKATKRVGCSCFEALGPVPATAPTSTNPVNTGSINLNTAFEEVNLAILQANSLVSDPMKKVFRSPLTWKLGEAYVGETFAVQASRVWVFGFDLPLVLKVLGTKWDIQEQKRIRKFKKKRSRLSETKARLGSQGHRQEEDLTMLSSQLLDYVDPIILKVYKVVNALYDCNQTLELVYKSSRTRNVSSIFISQDKYVAEILKKFDLVNVKAAITPMETKLPLTKDEEAFDVDVHLYRSMIGSLMYLTASRPDIMYAVCVCSRFQVTPKTSHLNAVKRIFKYLKGKPNLGLWYPRESPLDLEAFSDSDYGGSNLDRKSTTGGCQFLGQRLISWQCKKQTIVATSTTEAEYVAAANCCGQVLWVQNQLLDYGFNFMNTKIHIDNESTICIVKNPVYHSKTKHIEIRHHFIRDCYEKKLINVEKIHTNLNVADLLTKPFDGPRFNYLVVSIGRFQKHDAVAPSQPTSSSPPVITTPTPIPASMPSPTPIPETQPEPFEHNFEEPSPVHQHFSPPHEQAQGKMAMDDLLYLVKKVKKLEGLLKKRHMVVSDSEEEEPEAQGRKSQDDPLDSSVQGLVTPSTTKVNASGRNKEGDTREEKEAKGKKVVSSLDFQEEVDIGAEQTKTPKRLKDDEAKDAEPTRSQEKRKNIMQGNGLQKTLDEEESEDSDEVG
ncbi:hypothetical protein Tco_1045392 [Tanacetum coccineum]|uniref:Uncharacterized protein n=1 Tax=Tanacetum coccineum TaxID=301880 RepID=A0ABQ5GUS6_9ASTR